MGLYRVRLASQILSKNDNEFDLEDMMNPSFHNEGNTVAVVHNQEVPPGRTYVAEFPNGVMIGRIKVHFKTEGIPEPVNKLIVNYGLYQGPFTNALGEKMASQQYFGQKC